MAKYVYSFGFEAGLTVPDEDAVACANEAKRIIDILASEGFAVSHYDAYYDDETKQE